MPLIVPPPPIPVVAPAPPGAPGVGRKEEHEVQFEKEADPGGRHAFVAVSRKPQELDLEAAWIGLGGVALLAFLGALAAAGVRARRVEGAWVGTRRER